MRFDFEFGRSDRRGRKPRAEATTRVLVVADLLGARAAQAPPPAERPIVILDAEAFDGALAALGPAVSLEPLGVTEPLTVSSLDDFHPDRLVERVAVFERLRILRRRLQDPSTFREAAAELGSAAAGATADQPVPPQPDGADSSFERLLGGPRHAATGADRNLAADASHPTVDAFLRSIVAPHVVAAADPQLPQLLSALDVALGDTMRAVLHAPALQRLEATWRALRWLVGRAEGTDEHAVEVVAVHATRAELDDPAARASLLTRLTPRGGDGSPWSLLVADLAMGPSASDVSLLTHLAKMAAALGAPLVASATGAIVGCDDLGTQADPSSWTPLKGDEVSAWSAFVDSPEARHVGLVWPRMLLRLPYGARSDPIESFAFDEMPATHAHEDYLWGHGAWAAALTMVRESIDESGDAGDIDDLPAFAHTVGGESVLKACAEAFLPERALDAVLARGVMPLVSFRHRNAVRLVRVQSIAGTPLAATRSLS